MTDILNARVAALTIASRLRRAADELESQEITIKRQQQLTLYLAYDLSELARDSGADIDAEERERAESKLRFTPTREYCIDAIERFGVDAVYPGKKLTKEQAIERIKNTPDEEWYPADDVFWQRKEEP